MFEVPEAAQPFYTPARPDLHVTIWRDFLTASENGIPLVESDIKTRETRVSICHQGVAQSFQELATARATALGRVTTARAGPTADLQYGDPRSAWYHT
jgi:hypothetical protein